MDKDARFLGYGIRDLTIGQVLADKARRHGDRTYLKFVADGRAFTYADVERITGRLARGIAALGIRHGDHVAVMMENCPEQLWTYFALGRIGAVGVPVNTAAKGALLRYFLEHSDSVAVVTESHLLDRVAEVTPSLPGIRQVVVLPGEGEAGATTGVATVPFTEVQTGAEADPGPGPRFSDLAYLSYTSGTTGPSKGVMFTQAHTLLWSISNATTFGYGPTDKTYICLPLFHSNGYHASTATLMAGGTVILARRFSASRFWPDIREHGVTIFNALGSMQNILWSQPRSPDDARNDARFCVLTPTPSFALEWEKRYGVKIAGSYGLTDFGAATAFTANDPPSKLGSAGRARPGMEVRIVDEDDFELPAGEKGEIVLRSEIPWSTAQGYYKMPAETALARRNYWFHTGDRGYLDADGYLHFVDRIKDVVRRRGENISAFEVEQILLQHPLVADAAVYPVRSEMSEDEVAAAIVLRPGATLTEPALTEYCAGNMAYYMVPRFVQFVPDLPRTVTQKVEKYRLRQEAERDLAALWDRERAGIRLTR